MQAFPVSTSGAAYIGPAADVTVLPYRNATQSGVTGSTTLTVTPAALAVTSATMPNATINLACSATLAAIGGTALGGVAVIAVGSVALAAAGTWGAYKFVKWLGLDLKTLQHKPKRAMKIVMKV